MQKKKEIKKNNEYIFFSLCCLNLRLPYNSLVKKILYYSYVDKSSKDYLDASSVSKKCGIDIDVKQKKELYMKKYQKYKHSFNLVNEHIISYQNKYGKDAMVSIHKNLIKEQFEIHSLSEEEFKILCAIYSKIGTSEYQTIIYDEIRVRACGYRSVSIYLRAKGLDKLDMKNLFSDKVLNRIITKLSKDGGRNLFDRVRYGKIYYYSTKIRGSKLEKLILEIKKQNFIKRTMPEERTNRIKKQLNEFKKQYTKKTNNHFVFKKEKEDKEDC